MRRLFASVFATLLAASVVHCASAAARDSFDDEADGSVDAARSGSSGTPSEQPGITNDGSVPEAGTQKCDEDIDVVLVIDTSTTMKFVLDALEDEFETVVTAANALKTGAHFGAVFFQDNGILDTSGEESGGKVHLGYETLRDAFVTMRDEYTANGINPGDGPDGEHDANLLCEENSLDALHIAATEFPWRDNAVRVIVVVTDDTFLEKPDNYAASTANGTPVSGYGDYPAQYTVSETVAALQTARAKVFSFTSATNGCGASRRNAQSNAVTFGWSSPYGDNEPFPAQTGGENFDLAEVKQGDLHLAAAINDIVLAARCDGVN